WPGPGPRATRDSGRQTTRASWPGYATIALDRCPLDPGRGSFNYSHRPSSEGTFRVDTPGRTLYTRWIEAKGRLDPSGRACRRQRCGSPTTRTPDSRHERESPWSGRPPGDFSLREGIWVPRVDGPGQARGT